MYIMTLVICNYYNKKLNTHKKDEQDDKKTREFVEKFSPNTKVIPNF